MTAILQPHIEVFSYDDAKRRKPEMWKWAIDAHWDWSEYDPQSRTWKVLGSHIRWTRKNVAPKGLGEFVKQGESWIYVCPNGLAVPVGYEWYKSPTPPPLPKAPPYQRCGCREREHTCGACGQPFWVEMHGCADGYCTYCYYHG